MSQQWVAMREIQGLEQVFLLSSAPDIRQVNEAL